MCIRPLQPTPSWEQADPSSSSDACFLGSPGCRVPISKTAMPSLKAGSSGGCWCTWSSTGGAASQGQHWQSCLDSRLLSRTLKQTDAQPGPPTPEEPHQAWRAGRFSPKTPNPSFTFSRSLGLNYLSSSPGGDVILQRAQTNGAVGSACRRSPRQPV